MKFNNTSRIFWTLYGVDYWKPFLNRASLSVVLPYKISLELFDELEGTHQLPKGYYRRELYSMFQICLNYNIIVMIMVKILQKPARNVKHTKMRTSISRIFTLWPWKWHVTGCLSIASLFQIIK